MEPTYDTNFDEDKESQTTVWIKRIAIALVALLVLGAIGYGIKKLMSGGAPQKKHVTTVKLIPDTPPPPPPPPKEPPKEQPKPDAPKEIKVEQPKPAEAPPAESLKMEGPAGDGPSPFQAGAVSNDYKGGDVKSIGSDGGAKFNWYAGLVDSQIEAAIEKEKKLTVGRYNFVVSVWLKSNGEVERLDLIQSDASPEEEQTLKTVIESMPAIREAPPQDMPRPITLRIKARKMGQ